MDQLFKVFWSFKSEVKESREALPRSFSYKKLPKTTEFNDFRNICTAYNEG